MYNLPPMPERNPTVPPPFDQGVFLLHYNRGREAFQEGRLAEARRELEAAQKMRPDDLDVLNLLGLAYFKTSAFPEAEVIYRRLAKENPDVFILHSNLGLILFKQGKVDDAERFLHRAVELRPNYAKAQLYLGLLYRQRKKFSAAIEHLRVAGADKIIKEIEADIRGAPPQAPARRPAAARASEPQASRVPAETAAGPGQPVASSAPHAATGRQASPSGPDAPTGAPAASPAHRAEPQTAATVVAHSAARKLQEAVDDVPHEEDRRIDLARKIEGASRTFALHGNGFLEINFERSVHVKRGTVSSYSGNLKFLAEEGLAGTTAQTLVRAIGHGKLFVFEKGRKAFLLDLNEEFIFVEGGNLLALEDSLAYRVEPIYDTAYQRKVDTVKIFGKGSLAISTSIEPLTLRVTKEYPLSISSSALVAWTGNVIPTVVDDVSLASVMIESEAQSFQIRFEGEGVVISEQ
jgi:tetratricopeptide (TPR) repeat protein/uncharacterized protein (AIM24 family)